MQQKDTVSKQKLQGVYYTPPQLAYSIANLFATQNLHTVLEPSCGDGVFLDGLQRSGCLNRTNVDAVEISVGEAQKVQTRYQEYENVHVFQEDFFAFYNRVRNQKQYDLILGNPPYIRYHYLTEEQKKQQSNILVSNGMKANKLVNAWVVFLVACASLLSENGKIAFVLPADVLQVSYAENLRGFLSEQFAKITLITFEQLVFQGITQEVIVLIGEKGKEKQGIRMIEIKRPDELSTIDFQNNDFCQTQYTSGKWTEYFLKKQEMEQIQVIRSDSRFTTFSDYGVIQVGITTGNNDYFCISEDICEKYGLEDVTLPLLGRSSHIHGIFFTREDWESNRASGKKARLILFPDSPLESYPDKHKEYIEKGESSGEHIRYKCSIRDRWYIVPSVWIPDAFFENRSNLYPKLVLNRCQATSTDTIHRIKFHSGINPGDVLLAYYNSISFAFTEICGRSYGGGVLEITPGEMRKMIFPKVSNIPEEIRTNLLQYIDSAVRNREDIENVLDRVDQEILIDFLGIDAEWCTQCRGIWKKMQKRRLSR